jgi:drug/metabolite transporter (DMT)-like permease
MTERKTRLDAVATGTLLACCFIWGLNQVAAKAAMPEMPALWQAAVRSLGGALLVLAWARWRRIALFEHDGTLRAGLLAGGLFAAEFACIFLGLQFTTASRMVVFIYTAPFFVALAMPLVAATERLKPAQMLGLSIGFGGVVLAFAEGFSQPAAGPLQWLGDALGVAGGALWAATTLTIRASRLSTTVPEKTLLYQLAVSGLALAVAALASGARWPSAVGLLTVSSMVFQTVVVVFASYLAWFWLVRHYPATRLSAFTLLTPVFGLLLGALLLAEPVTPRLLVALATVAFGLWVVNRR